MILITLADKNNFSCGIVQ